jgi:poly-gamma-glutamate synthesis protein (capsule biosynthesis protein)
VPFRSIKLYPIDLGFKKLRWQFGRPKLAEEELAEGIIRRWAELSQPFGTKIYYEDGIGKVRF